MSLGKYSFGIGDRFGRQGRAQLAAMIRAGSEGLGITPVWNKSNREHTIVGTEPMDVRKEADDAVRASGWSGAYFVDADHIGLDNVDGFVGASDFFTIDVADFIGTGADGEDTAAFVARHRGYAGTLALDRIEQAVNVTEEMIAATAEKYLAAVRQAGRIYRRIEKAKGAGNFITEISMDETAQSQSPAEMFFILAAIAEEGIPVRTIAPKFTGRFNKGVDYVGSLAGFSREFEADLAVVALAVREFSLPESLKLSVHSGSDKFSIYAPISRAIKRFDAGLHLKTAGTTWLEELIGLAMAGGDGPAIAKQIYAQAFERMDELCKPYATVIDIDVSRLPTVEQVNNWDGPRFAAALRHDQTCPDYNPDFRQLLHVAYKIAAEMGPDYLDALDRHAEVIAQNVTDNIYTRHIRALFGP